MKEITKEMIDNYHYEHGEDFIDQNEHLFNGITLSSFMAGMRQEIAPLLWETINKEGKNYSIQQTQEIYDDVFGYDSSDLFYEDFVVAVNTTTVTKDRVLKILEK